MSEDRDTEVSDDPSLPQPIFILSDGTGSTAEKVVRAALRQFNQHVVHIRTFSQITTGSQLHNLFRRAARQQAMVVTTLVRGEIREAAERLALETQVRHVDLLGSLLGELGAFLDRQPVGVPGLLHTTDASYFKRIEAVEFTVKADDGKEPRMLRQADIILHGVSRTSKTPLSTFLAHKGYKVGNVPIVLDHPPPKELFEVDQRRIFGLTIAPEKLRQLRLSRLAAMRMSKGTNYGDMGYILAELEYADSFFRSHQWPVIDVTDKAIEETTGIILRIMRDRGLSSEADGDLWKV